MSLSRIAILIATVPLLGFDLWFLGQRCPASPSISISAALVAAFLQFLAVGIAVWIVHGPVPKVGNKEHPEYQLIALLVLAPISVLLMKQAVLYGDVAWGPKGAKSLGEACFHVRS